MKLSLDDVKALANRRYPGNVPTAFWVVGIALLLFAASMIFISAIVHEDSTHWRLPDGQELVLNAGQMTLGNMIVEKTQKSPVNVHLLVGVSLYVGVTLAGLIYILFHGSEDQKRRKQFVEHWVDTKEFLE